MQHRIMLMIMVLCCSVASTAHAKFSASIRDAVQSAYTPAEQHRGLQTAAEPLEWSKVHTFVVLEHAGIPADKAFWFVTNQEYQYRGVAVDLATSRMTTRRGSIYTYLDRGLVMFVSGVNFSGKTVYLRLLSADVYHPKEHAERYPSRVGVTLEFPLTPEMRSGDAAPVLAALAAWVQPFPDRASAERDAGGLVPGKSALQKAQKKTGTRGHR